jgi:hypothetical protein
LAALSIGLVAFAPVMVDAAHEHGKLPPGPISDRHELMESQGQQAQAINDAFSVGSEGFDVSIIQRSAQA